MAPALERTTECQCWNAAAGDNGGFVQEATGWKPSALHPTELRAGRAGRGAVSARGELSAGWRRMDQ